MRALRLASVPYLNAEPLIWPIERKIIENPHTISRATPGELVNMLLNDQVDCAVAPVASLLDNPGLMQLPDVAIACRGPVASVLLFHNDPLQTLTTIWLDPSSRTSNLLIRILRRKASDTPCEFIMPEGDGPPVVNLPARSGRLVIGDPALAFASELSADIGVSDLGALWKEQTNLPFVFAMWIARSGDIAAELVDLARQARDWSVLHLHEMIEPLAGRYDFRPSLVDRYLRTNITYMYGPREEAGMREYFKLARELDRKSAL